MSTFTGPCLSYYAYSNIEADQEPYNYTSGRWLRRDTVERELRVIHFDFDALQRKIIELCPNASAITSYEKKGGFNRVFIFHTNNQERIIARLPFKLAGPPRLTTNSEVATIKYRTFCTIRQSGGESATDYFMLSSTSENHHSSSENTGLE